MCFGTFCAIKAKNVQKQRFGWHFSPAVSALKYAKCNQVTGFPRLSVCFAVCFMIFQCFCSNMCNRESLGITPWIWVEILRLECALARFVVLRWKTSKNSVSAHRNWIFSNVFNLSHILSCFLAILLCFAWYPVLLQMWCWNKKNVKKGVSAEDCILFKVFYTRLL